MAMYHILGVPLRSGSLMPGSENDAKPYRDVGLLKRLQAAGCQAVDAGDVAIPSYLPHHAIPPIRSWPGPRIAWEYVAERIAPLLAQRDQVPLLIGCDCSVVVGTTQALMQAHGAEQVHLLYVDGDFDDAAPRADRCQSAAALAVWLATHGEPFRAGPPLKPSQVSVIGWSIDSQAGADRGGVHAWPLVDIRRDGAAAVAQRALAAIPASAAVVVHLDIDVLSSLAMPAAYFPHEDGLTMAEAADLLRVLLPDPRVRVIELTEYASLRDLDQRHVTQLVNLLVHALGRS